MKITIVGATGGIGRCLVEQATAAGHDVTALVRNPSKLQAQVHVEVTDLSRADPAVVEAAVAGADAVLSTLGPHRRAESGVTSVGTRPLIDAMQATGARRLLVISAAPVSTVPSPGRPHPPDHDPAEGFVTRHVLTPAIKAFLRDHYADLALMEDDLRESGLDWTSLRPPRLTNGRRTGVYRTALDQNLRRGLSISRADVADCMLRLIDDRDSMKHAVGVAY
jgi:putative NADH-flavin reductase